MGMLQTESLGVSMETPLLLSVSLTCRESQDTSSHKVLPSSHYEDRCPEGVPASAEQAPSWVPLVGEGVKQRQALHLTNGISQKWLCKEVILKLFLFSTGIT